MRTRWLAFVLPLLFSLCSAQKPPAINVGSKKFTESYILAEIAKRSLMDLGIEHQVVNHKQGMGGTIILWQALKNNEIDTYPEYTGTIAEEILKKPGLTNLDDIRRELKSYDMTVSGELGFNDTYALCMTEKRAAELGISKISDLRNHPALIAGVTPEFLGRKDGWKPLSAKYGLHIENVKGIEHALGYEALTSGQIDVKDAYSTDAKLAEYHLVVLKDDLNYFPEYKAVFIYRAGNTLLPSGLRKLEGTIDEKQMTALNALAEKTKDYSAAANEYFANIAKTNVRVESESIPGKILRNTLVHLGLVGASLLVAILIGIPLGIWARRKGALSAVILGLAGIFQTIPSLALLAMLVPIAGLGISWRTAVVALFFYSLLPIVRNTATGLQDIPGHLKEAAAAIGLTEPQRLWKVYMPMASRSILGGIKTAAVINVGTATLAGLIGAGGLGEPIISGLNLNDIPTILQGAVPAALLALLVQALFDTLDRVIIPKGLRLGEARS